LYQQKKYRAFLEGLPVQTLLCLALLMLSPYANWTNASSLQPCKNPPRGMACVKGGWIKRGQDPKFANEQPPHKIYVPTFYMDKTEVSNQSFQKCVQAGFCFRSYSRRIPLPYRQAAQPATFVNWFQAHNYCRWQGKRLPTEAEWDRAARGRNNRRYPVGKRRPNCRQAHTWTCYPRRPIQVKSKITTSFGLYHMSGNVMEWTQDWYAPCFMNCPKACGKACTQFAPKGPCSGRQHVCPGYPKARVVKGGSWRHSTQKARSGWRVGLSPWQESNYLGFRCASSHPILRLPTQPSQLQKRPFLASPQKPLTRTERRLFTQTPTDDLKLKKLCPNAGRSGKHCRDPQHYIKSNEKRQHIFRPYVQNIGGGYIGIGADQNYNFIAWARSSLVWLMDYDAEILHIHQVHRALLLRAKTNRTFLAFWKPSSTRKTLALLQKDYVSHPKRKHILRAYTRYRARLYKYFSQEFQHPDRANRHHWLVFPKYYNHIRTLYQLNRIRTLPGDLLKRKSFRGIILAAKKLSITIRVLYLSNAEEYWYYPRHYRKSIALLQFDKRSVILHTQSHPRWGHKRWGHFHYNVTHALFYQKLLQIKDSRTYRGYYYRHIRDLMRIFRHKGPGGKHTYVGLPHIYQKSR